MKKKLFLCMIVILLLCACSNKDKFVDFEHYDLSDKDLNTYSYINDNGRKEAYALADMTPSSYESNLTGLFYKINNNDYILLETLEYSTENAYKKDNIYRFYDNKLYGVGNGDSPMVFEIELNEENSSIKELEFKINGTENSFFGNMSIKNIEDDYITLSGYIFIDEHSEYKNFVCSLNSYQCEIQ